MMEHLESTERRPENSEGPAPQQVYYDHQNLPPNRHELVSTEQRGARKSHNRYSNDYQSNGDGGAGG